LFRIENALGDRMGKLFCRNHQPEGTRKKKRGANVALCLGKNSYWDEKEHYLIRSSRQRGREFKGFRAGTRFNIGGKLPVDKSKKKK